MNHRVYSRGVYYKGCCETDIISNNNCLLFLLQY